jgi:hypothetical protein
MLVSFVVAALALSAAIFLGSSLRRRRAEQATPSESTATADTA